MGNTSLGKENTSNKKGSFSNFISSIKVIEVDLVSQITVTLETPTPQNGQMCLTILWGWRLKG